MITKERLEELIEQGALIYCILNNSVTPLQLNNSYGISVEKYNKEYNCKPQFYHSGYVYQNICDADKIFETEEDAEFALEIRTSKTVWFEPPLYEEFLKLRSFGFVSDDDVSYYLYYRYNKIFLEDREFFGESKVWKLNKENYLEACRFCKKLFLGEEV